MNSLNKKTIASYNSHIKEYVYNSPQQTSQPIKKLFHKTFLGMPKSCKVLEIGSGFGRDASYLNSLGYNVKLTDASSGFIEWLIKNGQHAVMLDVLHDEIVDQYDVIVAIAVLLHFSKVESKTVLIKLFNSLKPGGRLALSLKQGNGEEWSDDKLGVPRYFCYWQPSEIINLLSNVGFRNIDLIIDKSRTPTIWLMISAAK